MTPADIRARGRRVASVTTVQLMDALADVVEAAKVVATGVCEDDDLRALDAALARVEALKP